MTMRTSSGCFEKSGERAAGTPAGHHGELLQLLLQQSADAAMDAAASEAAWGASGHNTAAATCRDALQARTVQLPWASVEDHQSRVSLCLQDAGLVSPPACLRRPAAACTAGVQGTARCVRTFPQLGAQVHPLLRHPLCRARDLIRQLLVLDPLKRPSAQQVRRRQRSREAGLVWRGRAAGLQLRACSNYATALRRQWEHPAEAPSCAGQGSARNPALRGLPRHPLQFCAIEAPSSLAAGVGAPLGGQGRLCSKGGGGEPRELEHPLGADAGAAPRCCRGCPARVPAVAAAGRAQGGRGGTVAPVFLCVDVATLCPHL